ncbi:hypothetical protein DRN74_06160 [Candidatus Micrarchaeota archaeon]|nr:MAG: hypothetical protein DRN74_06160 [Candidatus Micrarchaeota archaeon]
MCDNSKKKWFSHVGLKVSVMLALALLVLTLASVGWAAPMKLTINGASPQGQSTLGDYVWYDANRNGWPDGGETGFDGVLVKLWLDDGDGVFEPGTDDAFQAQMLTGDDPQTPGVEHGWYDFPVTANGNSYWVEVDDSNFAPGGVLEGYTLTSGGTKGPEPMWVYLPDVVMDYDEADFGYYKYGSIGDYVWNDANGNGVQDEGAGYGINGVTVNLYQGACPPSGSPYSTTVTAGDGGYEFTMLVPGDYCVDVDESSAALAGYEFIPGSQSGPEPHDVSLGIGEEYNDADFGYAGRGTIAGIVWYDWNENGVQELPEEGIEGVTVTLYSDSSCAGPPPLPGNQLSQTLTLADGSYTFPGLLPGCYLVEEENPPGYEDASWSPNVLQVQLIVIGPSGSDVDNNFGDLAWAGLGDFAYNDENGNGVQDGGESSGIPGVGLLIEGVDLYGSPFSAYTTTNSSGYYLQGELIPGTYTVTVVLTPTGYILTSEPVMSADLGPGEEELGLDFGFMAPTGFALLDLRAEMEGEVVRISWNLQGGGWWEGEFNIYRSEVEEGERERVNDEPIVGSVPGGAGGAWYYAWYDVNVEAGKRYYYWLESVGYADGQTTLYGPVWVEVAGPGGLEIVPWLYLPMVASG